MAKQEKHEGPKRPLGIYILSTITTTISLVSCVASFIDPFPLPRIFYIITLGWLEMLPWFSRVELLSIVLDPIGYYISSYRLYIPVLFFLVISNMYLITLNNWARKFLVAYCKINIVCLISGYFLKPIFTVSIIAKLNMQIFSQLNKIPNFYARYLAELNPFNLGISTFLINWFLPVILYIVFIYYFTRLTVTEQFQ